MGSRYSITPPLEQEASDGKQKAVPALAEDHRTADKKAMAKEHRYMIGVSDLEETAVEYFGDASKEEGRATDFYTLGEEHCAGIEAISLDLCPAFINACLAHVQGSANKMVFDRFHIMPHVDCGVDRVHKQEHKALTAQGDDTLAGSK